MAIATVVWCIKIRICPEILSELNVKIDEFSGKVVLIFSYQNPNIKVINVNVKQIEWDVQNVFLDIIKLIKSVSVSIVFKPKLSPSFN